MPINRSLISAPLLISLCTWAAFAHAEDAPASENSAPATAPVAEVLDKSIPYVKKRQVVLEVEAALQSQTAAPVETMPIAAVVAAPSKPEKIERAIDDKTQLAVEPVAINAVIQPERLVVPTPPIPVENKVVAEVNSEVFTRPTDTKSVADFTEPAPVSISNARDEILEFLSDSKLEKNAPRDLWERVRSGYALQDFQSPLIAKHEQWYAGRPDYIMRMTTRARRYMYYIVSEVERRGMPMEIALLPMIESAFNPVANSVSSASGIWQFIPSTGKNFGLQQNWWYDGRRDVIGATNSALNYLQKLYNMFGDWQLALAAYNWGEGAVQRAQEKNRKRGLPTNYASLDMPDQTRNYLPKLLAIKNIIANPKKFGLTLQKIPNEPYFTAVSTPKHIDVKLAARLADISEDEFAALNPAHNRPVVLQKKGDLLVLPIDKVTTFNENLANYDKPLVSWQIYQPKKGERLDRLAPRLGLSLDKLKSINGLASRSQISTGQTLLVPASSDDEEKVEEFKPVNMHLASAQEVEHKLKPETPRVVKHTIHKGNTLASLARQYHVSVKQLKQWNGPLKTMKPGQVIVVAKLEVDDVSHAKAERSVRKADRLANHKLGKKTQHVKTVASSKSRKNKSASYIKEVKKRSVSLAQAKNGA